MVEIVDLEIFDVSSTENNQLNLGGNLLGLFFTYSLALLVSAFYSFAKSEPSITSFSSNS